MKRLGGLPGLFVIAFSLLVLTAGAATGQQQAQSLRLYVFDCGSIEVLDISYFQGGVGKGERKMLDNPCYLVTHPKGTLLWDAGLPDELALTPEGKTIRGMIFRVTNPLATQLKKIGYTPETVNYLGLSHMHYDHVGNVGLFPRATLLIQKVEHEAAFGPEPYKYGFTPTAYATLRSNPVKILEGEHDVFGDGTVLIKSAPGHSPGHQVLYLRLAKTGNIMLSGDMVHFADNWKHKRMPSFNFDKDRSKKTMDEIEQFLKTNNTILWIQHDAEQNATIKRAPDYYE
jgi:N-acyl homoserine lactone hydrolase